MRAQARIQVLTPLVTELLAGIGHEHVRRHVFMSLCRPADGEPVEHIADRISQAWESSE